MVKIYMGIIFHVNNWKATNHSSENETDKTDVESGLQPAFSAIGMVDGSRLDETDPCMENQMATHSHLALRIEQNLDSIEYISNFLGPVGQRLT